MTPVERPDWIRKPTVTAEEAAAWEKRAAEFGERGSAPTDPNEGAPDKGDDVGGYNSFWIDAGTRVAKVRGEYRTSIVVDPPDGRIPYKPEARAKLFGLLRNIAVGMDGPEQRPLGERCIVGFGSTAGPPMLPVLYNNHYQIVQSPGYVMILVEMNHDARIVRLGGEHLPSNIPTVAGRFDRSLGRRHARHRNDEHESRPKPARVHSTSHLLLAQREGDGTSEARRTRRARIQLHDRRSRCVYSAVAGRDAVARGIRTDLRIRVPRRKLLVVRNPRRRATAGKRRRHFRWRLMTITRNPYVRAVLALALAAAAPHAAAHHAFAAEFDPNAPVLLQGKVTKVQWINPHAWVHVAAAKEDGTTQEWMVEGGTPNTLLRAGINRDSLTPGTEIVVRGYQAKDKTCQPACKANGARRDVSRRSQDLHGLIGHRRAARWRGSDGAAARVALRVKKKRVKKKRVTKKRRKTDPASRRRDRQPQHERRRAERGRDGAVGVLLASNERGYGSQT